MDTLVDVNGVSSRRDKSPRPVALASLPLVHETCSATAIHLSARPPPECKVSCQVLSRPVLSCPDPASVLRCRRRSTSPGWMTFVTPIFGLLIWRRKGPRGSGRSQKDGCHLGVVGSVWLWLLFGQFLLGAQLMGGGRWGAGKERPWNVYVFVWNNDCR